MELIIVSGGVDSGKTSWCKSFAEHNCSSDGILLVKVYHGRRRIGYDALRIATGDTIPFSRRVGSEPELCNGSEKVGGFSVSAEAKRTANRWILEAAEGDCRNLIIDEIGPLELRGGGLADSFRKALWVERRQTLIAVIRRQCLERATEVFKIAGYRLFDLD